MTVGAQEWSCACHPHRPCLVHYGQLPAPDRLRVRRALAIRLPRPQHVAEQRRAA